MWQAWCSKALFRTASLHCSQPVLPGNGGIQGPQCAPFVQPAQGHPGGYAGHAVAPDFDCRGALALTPHTICVKMLLAQRGKYAGEGLGVPTPECMVEPVLRGA